MSKDYVPHNAAQFNVFMKKIVDYAGARKDEWTHIPPDRSAALNDKYSAFETAYQNAVNTPTPANTLTKNEAQGDATHELRAFVNQFLRFPPVTNADRVEMGIPNHDTVRTDHKVVTEMVDYVLHLRNIREIMVDFWVQGGTSKAKPAGYDGAVIVWGIRDAPPQHPDELNHHAMASRTPFALHFEEAERGKTIFVAAAWQNERGILGQWSEYKSAVIP